MGHLRLALRRLACPGLLPAEPALATTDLNLEHIAGASHPTPNHRSNNRSHRQVYPEGKMSQHIDKLRVGDTLDVKGPLMKMKVGAGRG